MTEIINLRGHHLKSLKYGWRELLRQQRRGENKLTPYETFYRTYEFWHCHFGYSYKYIKHVSNLFSKIIEGNVKVRLTCTLDDICEKCNLIKRGCISPKSEQAQANKVGDIETIALCSLKLGRVYTSKYILKKLKEGPCLY